MTYFVDANVLSEATKPKPSTNVVNWLRSNEREFAVDPIVLGEIWFGIHQMSSGKRRRNLERWFDKGIQTILCLPWDSTTGLRWGALLADLRASGQSMPIKDSMIAATALVHDLIVVTRNVDDFRLAGLQVLNPF